MTNTILTMGHIRISRWIHFQIIVATGTLVTSRSPKFREVDVNFDIHLVVIDFRPDCSSFSMCKSRSDRIFHVQSSINRALFEGKWGLLYQIRVNWDYSKGCKAILCQKQRFNTKKDVKLWTLNYYRQLGQQTVYTILYAVVPFFTWCVSLTSNHCWCYRYDYGKWKCNIT